MAWKEQGYLVPLYQILRVNATFMTKDGVFASTDGHTK
jgi:hypothetical protein